MNDIKRYDATGKDFGTDMMIATVIGGFQPVGVIGPELMPPVEVPRQFGVYQTLGGRPRLESLARGPGAELRQVRYAVTSTSYFCQGYGVMQMIPTEDLANADVGEVSLRDRGGSRPT